MVVDDDFVFCEIVLCMFERFKYRGKVIKYNMLLSFL